jgi:hypothetical protein
MILAPTAISFEGCTVEDGFARYAIELFGLASLFYAALLCLDCHLQIQSRFGIQCALQLALLVCSYWYLLLYGW